MVMTITIITIGTTTTIKSQVPFLTSCIILKLNTLFPRTYPLDDFYDIALSLFYCNLSVGSFTHQASLDTSIP